MRNAWCQQSFLELLGIIYHHYFALRQFYCIPGLWLWALVYICLRNAWTHISLIHNELVCVHSFCDFCVSGNKGLTLLPSFKQALPDHRSWGLQGERTDKRKECRNKDYPEVALWLKYTWILITVNIFISCPSEETVSHYRFCISITTTSANKALW